MNKTIFKSAAFIALMLFISCAARKSMSGQTPSDKEVNNWFNKNEWSGGLQLRPYADVDKRELYIQYHKHPEWWDKAFAYLKANDLAKLPNGKVAIVGDSVFITVTEAPDKDLDKTMWESHKKMIDLQYIISGKEEMRVADATKLMATNQYNDARDVMNYTGEGKSYIAEPGTYYLFFPNNAHRPSIKVPGYDMVKKAVIKIRYSK